MELQGCRMHSFMSEIESCSMVRKASPCPKWANIAMTLQVSTRHLELPPKSCLWVATPGLLCCGRLKYAQAILREHRSLRSIQIVAVIQLEAWVGELGKSILCGVLINLWLPVGTAVVAFRPPIRTSLGSSLSLLLCPFIRKSPSFP
ncbi:hypothetical protein CY34DRAFT_302879 [Suillus luteus UH-Slu-Lm8-n1]|uniref:Uncharacterized protein n=1 Tax=Suillus luteus UH-Slu-Lm8-n1 TaxID=930992 RepID=A0A0D0B7I6_9AGAM|nr:hypothetical protein CY34DRAFT_302879 [Suillus luteus UH-Slu-Lm8-n1]